MLDFKHFMIKESADKVNKEDRFVELYLSPRFINVLSNMTDNIIRESFIKLIKNTESGHCNGKFDVSFIDVTDKDDYISYITSNKAKPVIDKYKSIDKLQNGLEWCWLNNRQEQKLSRLIPRIFGKTFELKDIEEFVENYKVSLNKNKKGIDFQLISGHNIKKYYNGNSYSSESNGQLQKSCMKYTESQKFFKLYEDNPDKMNMLILKGPGDKIYGRANIWYLDDPEGMIFMDRIYTTYDWQVKLFIDYAIKNNWIYKSRQIYGGNVVPLYINGKKEKKIISVNLKPLRYDYYPYIDTMQFYNPNTGELTSDVSKFEDSDFLTLVLANGGTYVPDEDETYKIDYLGRIVHGHFLRKSKYDNVNVHVNDAIYLEYRNDFVTPEHEFIKINGMICLMDDTVKDPVTGEHNLKNNF